MTPLKRLAVKNLRPLVISFCLSTSILSGCSTLPAKESLLVPPQAAMQTSRALPLLPERPVTLKEFVDNDLEVVAMYHDLATYHDALVAWVNQILDQQANSK
jgi:hypothetical protein